MDLNEIMNDIALKYHLDSIGLFGSRSRGDFHEGSDYDVFIIADCDLNTEFKIEAELESIFNTDVDVVRLNKDLDKSLLKNILNDAKVIVNNNNAFDNIYNYVDSFFIENSDFLWYREQDLIYG